MEINQGNLASLYTGLRGEFRQALEQVKIPEFAQQLVLEVPSSVSREEIPTAAFLGDMEELLDQYGEVNLGNWLLTVENRYFGRILKVPRANIEEDTLGLVRTLLGEFARRCATFPYRRIPDLFVGGFTTAWVDGANVFSNNHTWPGGQTWDNLDAVPLTVAGFEQVAMNLMNRVGPDGQSLDLTPTHLIVGPAYWVRARQIIHRQLIGGGDSNIHYQEVEVVKWSRLRGDHAYDWFVADFSPDKIKPIVLLNRVPPEFAAQDSPTSDGAFLREEYRYKVSRRFGMAIAAPWRIQAVQQGDEPVTTTTAS